MAPLSMAPLYVLLQYPNPWGTVAKRVEHLRTFVAPLSMASMNMAVPYVIGHRFLSSYSYSLEGEFRVWGLGLRFRV